MKIWGGGHPGTLGVIVVGVGLGGLLAGCGTEVSNQAVTSGSQLCRSTFETCINPIFNLPMRRNSASGDIVQCASGGCHEVGAGFGGSFKVYANSSDATELQANFIVSQAFSNLSSAADSKLLLEPLAGTSLITGSHTGGDIFPGTGDNCYAIIRDWIATVVVDQSSSACFVCGAGQPRQVPTSCGY